MSYQPSWAKHELWYQSACNKAVNSPEKKWLLKLFDELHEDPAAQSVFHQVTSALQASGHLTELELIDELTHDPRWDVRVELVIQRLKSGHGGIELLPPGPFLKKVKKWIKDTWKQASKSEYVQKGTAQVAAAAVATSICVPIGIKLIKVGSDPTFNVKIAGLVDSKTQTIPVSFSPAVDGQNKPISFPFQWTAEGHVSGEQINIPVGFTMASADPLKIPVIGSVAKGAEEKGGSSGSTDVKMQCCDAARADLERLVLAEQKIKMLTDEIAKVNVANGELVKQMDKWDARAKGIDGAVEQVAGNVKSRQQTISVSLMRRDEKTVRLDAVDDEGQLKNCTVKLSTFGIVRSKLVRVDYDTCSGKLPESITIGENRAFPFGSTQWAVAIDSSERALVGKYPIQVRLVGTPLVVAKTNAKPAQKAE